MNKYTQNDNCSMSQEIMDARKNRENTDYPKSTESSSEKLMSPGPKKEVED